MTVSIADLKAHLSAEIKKVTAGEVLTILDHRKPVAQIVPMQENIVYTAKAKTPYPYPSYSTLVSIDPLIALELERTESW